MQKPIVTQSTTETDAMFDTSPAVMAWRLTELQRRQLRAGLFTAAASTAALAAIHARRASEAKEQVTH